MSVTKKTKKITIPTIQAMKGDQQIVCLTAYTTPQAKLLDPHCELVLVGDSVGMVLHGMESTLEVTLEMMILHAKAVKKGLKQAVMVVDLPFGTYEQSPQQAFEAAARVMSETGCDAVKLEGGAYMAKTIEFLTERGIPVMAHLGLTPQSVNSFGGYKVQGRGEDGDKILQDAIAVSNAGAFAVVLEKLPTQLAKQITMAITIPTIGIGASNLTDGQILVTEDMLGLFADFQPKFVKRYANLQENISKAVAEYASEVKNQSFPSEEHSFK
ncbi:3-methyl-2-oxobutanoate hydroxymethyltransferase [Polycladidibacter stylochi]|uniref:3-methyl-2-oxobutanoate hydroxymethyltransferase n=1 Tax=Polycladidibacter stylochi TaxID=1807766 RepID=UPI0008354920|nr:3-methyl-2-oxobutanoate hydroxymethyltransferase [Pseudovibrio stylochi]